MYKTGPESYALGVVSSVVRFLCIETGYSEVWIFNPPRCLLSLFHFAFGVSLPFGLRLVLVFCSGVRCFLPFPCFLFIVVRCLFSPLCSPVRPSPSGLGHRMSVSPSPGSLRLCFLSWSQLFCYLRSSVSDIGFLAFASTQRLCWGLLVVVAVLGVCAIGL